MSKRGQANMRVMEKLAHGREGQAVPIMSDDQKLQVMHQNLTGMRRDFLAAELEWEQVVAGLGDNAEQAARDRLEDMRRTRAAIEKAFVRVTLLIRKRSAAPYFRDANERAAEAHEIMDEIEKASVGGGNR